jgi:hypothetical protein
MNQEMNGIGEFGAWRGEWRMEWNVFESSLKCIHSFETNSHFLVNIAA